MTIAACYVCPEGVVLGADSTTTFVSGTVDGHPSHFNFAQKLFEVGASGSLGIVTWGLGAIGSASYRTMIAELADELESLGHFEVSQAADIWCNKVWTAHRAALQTEISRYEALNQKQNRTPDEDEELLAIFNSTGVGFCIGGRGTWNREPTAFEFTVTVASASTPVPQQIQIGEPKFWGWSNFIDRLIYGLDQNVFDEIMNSGHWMGSDSDLLNIVAASAVSPPGILPIREGIDWVHSSIYSTIKAFKFSRLDVVCGGPIEVAVITSDRRFRWVCHKELDAAIN